MLLRRPLSSFGGAWIACLQFALCAFVNVPVWTGMAHVAIPEDQCCVGLDHLERVFAFRRFGHCDCAVRQ